MRITLDERDLRAILRMIADRAFVLVCSMTIALAYAIRLRPV